MLFQKRLLSMFCLTSLITIGCGKKDDSEPAATESAPLALEITTGCGTDGKTNCFSKNITALVGDESANLTSSESQLESMLLFSWMMVGFPDTKATYYRTMFDTEAKRKLVPQDGMVGRIEGIRKTVVEGVQKALPSLASCAEAPTSGAFKIDDMDFTWTTPIMTTPADYPNSKGGKKYDKAILHSRTEGDYTVDYRFEIFCDYNGMALTMTSNRSGAEKQKMVFFYDRNDKAKLFADFYLYDVSGIFSSSADEIDLVFLMRQSSENKIKSYVTRTGANGTGNALGYRYSVNADISVPSISFHTIEYGTGTPAIASASWLTNAAVTASTVSGGVAPSTSSGTDAKNGCASAWQQAWSGMTTATTCSGLDLSEAPAPFWSSTAKLSMAEVYSNLRTKVLGLK